MIGQKPDLASLHCKLLGRSLALGDITFGYGIGKKKGPKVWTVMRLVEHEKTPISTPEHFSNISSHEKGKQKVIVTDRTKNPKETTLCMTISPRFTHQK
mgnify:CR=1 FL=1